MLVDLNSEAVPLALFGAALAGKPFVPVNYRLADDQLQAILERTAPATVIVGEGVARSHRRGRRARGDDPRRAADDRRRRGRRRSPTRTGTSTRRARRCCCSPAGPPVSPRRRCCDTSNLASYILMTVEFAGAGEDEATIVSRPAVPHRRDLLGAVGHLCGASDRAPRGVRPGRVGGHRADRGRHPRHGRADHAQPDPRRDRGRRERPAHAAGALLRRRSDAGAGHRAGHGACCPTWAT